MPNRMLKFIELGLRPPDKREATARLRDFDEIYREFDAGQAADQAGRCSQCGVPFCQVHCPVHNNIPDWLLMAAEGRLQGAKRALAGSMDQTVGCPSPAQRHRSVRHEGSVGARPPSGMRAAVAESI